MGKYLTQKDLYSLLPFGKTKILQLLKSGEFPAVRIGKDYITTEEKINTWITDNIGEEIFF